MDCQKGAHLALRAFLDRVPLSTQRGGLDLQNATLRTLALLILRSQAHDFFDANALAPLLDAAMNALEQWPLADQHDLDDDDLIALADLFYLCASQQRARTLPPDLERNIQQAMADICAAGDPLTPWLVQALLEPFWTALERRYSKPFVPHTWLQVYVDTHVIFLRQGYGIAGALTMPGAHAVPQDDQREALQRMWQTVPELRDRQAWDALAEVGLCTLLVGAQFPDFGTPHFDLAAELKELTEGLLGAQTPQGELFDRSYDEDGIADHATAVALLVFAMQCPKREDL